MAHPMIRDPYEIEPLAGPVDATPAPVAGSVDSPTTFSVDGVSVSAVPSAVHFLHHSATAVAAGDEVAASGTFAAGVLGVAATQPFDNFVLDFGAPRVIDGDVPLH